MNFLFSYNKKYLSLIILGSFIYLFKMVSTKNNKKKFKKINAISFGPTGANFSYQLGITKYLQNNFILDNFKYAAVSGGTHSAFCLGFDLKVDYFFYKFTLNTFNKKNENCNLFNIARSLAKNIISKNTDLNCINKKLDKSLYIGLTRINPYLRSEFINIYKNFDDMFDCLLASQCIPFINYNKPYYTYRNNFYIDGYICNSNFIPIEANWYYLDIFDFKKKVSLYEYCFSGFYNLKYLCDEDFHYNQYILGFNDAKDSHIHFLNAGFIEK